MLRLQAPHVSVVIPCFGQADTLWDCLDSVARLNHPRERLETIVVYRDFSQAQKERLASYGVRRLEVFRPGSAHARNAGLGIAAGTYVAFLDSDCMPERPWLSGLLAKFRADWVGGVGGAVRSQPPRSWVQRYIDRRLRAGKTLNQKVALYEEFLFPFLTSQNCMFPREVLLRLGPWDENLVSGDDADLCWRLFLEGYQLLHAERAVVHHFHPPTFAAFVRQQLRCGRAIEDLMRKYRRFPLRVAGHPHRFPVYARELVKACTPRANWHPDDAGLSAAGWLALMGGRLYQASKRILAEDLPPLEPPPRRYAWQLVEDERVVFKSLESVERIELDELASRLWLDLVAGKTPNAIVEELLEEYDVSREEAERSVRDFLGQVRPLSTHSRRQLTTAVS